MKINQEKVRLAFCERAAIVFRQFEFMWNTNGAQNQNLPTKELIYLLVLGLEKAAIEGKFNTAESGRICVTPYFDEINGKEIVFDYSIRLDDFDLYEDLED